MSDIVTPSISRSIASDFSTHADTRRSSISPPHVAKQVVVYHTDPTHARPPLVEALESNGHIVHSPENGVSGML